MSKRQVRQRFRQWAEMPKSAPVVFHETTIEANSPEEAKTLMETVCRVALAGSGMDHSVEIVDGQIQLFFHNK